MALYKIEWKRSALKELRQLPQSAVLKALSIVKELTTDPYPKSSRKLSGTDHTYRIRFGDYRLIYNLMEQVLTIEVIRIGHRKNVYRNLP
jgi:mRNA interferase RelE/StbE